MQAKKTADPVDTSEGQKAVSRDLNLNGLVTCEELQRIAPSMLPEINELYQLGGSPNTPLTNMYQFVMAQFKTQGHFQGEGECPEDGVAHDHGHGHHH